MSKHSGKSRAGKVLGLVGAIAGGFYAGALFGVGTTATMGAIYGLSLGTTIASAFFADKSSTTASSFDAKMNDVSQEARIPLVYGTRKIGGLQSYHEADVDDKKLTKDVILGEGQFTSCRAITANNYMCKVTNANGYVFGLENTKYSDARVAIWNHTLYLFCNGTTEKIALSKTSDLEDDQSNDYNCYLAKLYNYIEGINYDNDLATNGWKVVDPVLADDQPHNLSNTTGGKNGIACYNSAVYFSEGSYETGNSTVAFYDGSQSAPSYYEKTGAYPNMAYLHAVLRYTDKLGSGNPVLNCIVQGRKVYDTRTGTWGYSENPAMIVRDYLLNKTFGSGYFISEDVLDEDSFKEVANYCDETVTRLDSQGRSIYEKRYTMNLVLTEKETYLEHIQQMLACFAGFLVFSNGQVSLRVEKAESAVYAFNDDNIVKDSITYKALSSTDSPNRLVMKYVEPVLNWTSTSALVEDLADQQPSPVGRGKIVSKDVELIGVTSQSQASRLGKMYRDIVRLCPLTVSFKTAMQAMHLEPGDIVTFSHSVVLDGVQKDLFTNMPLRIVEMQDDNGEFTLTCKQYNASIYDDALGGNLQTHSYSTQVKLTDLLPVAVPQVENLDVATIYRQYLNGQTGYDLVVTYDLPDGYSLETGLVYYKTNGTSGENAGVISEDVAGDEIGWTADWTYAGDSSNKVTIPQVTIGDTYKVMVIARNKNGDTSSEANAATATITIAAKETVPNTPQNFAYDFSSSFSFSWDYVTNSDVDFYELRLDENAGTTGDNLLGRSTTNSITVTLKNRTDTVYLYAHNKTYKYSYPATLTYNVPKLDAPTITADLLLNSANITIGAMPSTANSINLYITGENYAKEFNITNTVYNFTGDPNIYDVTAAYVDIFGEGYVSQAIQVVINATIDPKYLADESITLAKVDSDIQTAVDNANNSVPRLDTIDTSIDGINKSIVSINETTDSISQTVASNKTTQDGVNSTVSNEISQIQQTATSLASTVQSNKTSQDSTNSTVSDAISQIKQTASSLTATVQSNKTSQDSTNATVSDEISQIQQTATSLSATVQENKTNQDTTNSTLTSQISANAISISSVVSNLNNTDTSASAYSAIAQLATDIALRVKENDVINQINISTEGITINGAMIHITGDTVFDDNVIVESMIKAGAVSADKLAAETITLGDNTVNGFVGGAVTLDSSGLKTTCSNGSYVKHDGNGITFFDSNGNSFAGIGRFCTGVASDGNTVTFNNAWDITPSVFLFPTSLQTNSTDYASTNIYQQVMATDISKYGFKVICRSIMKSGSGSSVAVNNQFANWSGKAANSGGATYSKTITFPSSATTFNGSVTISCTSKYTAKVGGNNYLPAVSGETYADIQWGVDGNVIESMHQVLYVFGADPNGASNSINISKSISLSNNTNVTVTVRFRGGYSGDGSGDLSTPDYSSGNAIFNSYSVNTSQDTVIATGKAGFIAVDANAVPYTIS